jgi:hypothetical protein
VTRGAAEPPPDVIAAIDRVSERRAL